MCHQETSPLFWLKPDMQSKNVSAIVCHEKNKVSILYIMVWYDEKLLCEAMLAAQSAMRCEALQLFGKSHGARPGLAATQHWFQGSVGYAQPGSHPPALLGVQGFNPGNTRIKPSYSRNMQLPFQPLPTGQYRTCQSFVWIPGRIKALRPKALEVVEAIASRWDAMASRLEKSTLINALGDPFLWRNVRTPSLHCEWSHCSCGKSPSCSLQLHSQLTTTYWK